MNSIMFIIAAFALLVPQANAVEAPEAPTVISSYVQSIIEDVEKRLSSVQSRRQSCDADEEEMRVSNDLRTLFIGIDALKEGIQNDIGRSVCFYHDASALEKYVSALVFKSIVSAADCEITASYAYADEAKRTWRALMWLRTYGLRPDIQAPLSGTGFTEIPSGASPDSDNALCPYHSAYAPAGLMREGCQPAWIPSPIQAHIRRELKVWHNILNAIGMQSIGASSPLQTELSFYRESLAEIWSSAAGFVDQSSVMRFVRLPILNEPTFTPGQSPDNAGESGCLGWQSNVTRGPVTAEGISLQASFPYVLTSDLEATMKFLEQRREEKWKEYLQGEQSFLLFHSPFVDMNQMHIDMESFAILSIRDAQVDNENIANSLHYRTRRLASEVVTLPGAPASATNGPPLRDFIRRYAGFLSRMCINRGCGEPLLRAIELSQRDECFSSFLLDRFFRENGGTGRLPPCEAVFLQQ